MKIIVNLIIIIFVVWIFYGIFLKQTTWQAFYETASSPLIQSGPVFNDKNECIEWLSIQHQSPGDRYSFECGKNCTSPQSPLGPWRCEETVD